MGIKAESVLEDSSIQTENGSPNPAQGMAGAFKAAVSGEKGGEPGAHLAVPPEGEAGPPSRASTPAELARLLTPNFDGGPPKLQVVMGPGSVTVSAAQKPQGTSPPPKGKKAAVHTNTTLSLSEGPVLQPYQNEHSP